MNNLSVCPPFEKIGKELIGKCCAPHSCGEEMSYISLDSSDRTISCAILSSKFSTQGYKAPFGNRLRRFSEKKNSFSTKLNTLINESPYMEN